MILRVREKQLYSYLLDPFGRLVKQKLHTEVAEVTGVNFSRGSQHSLSVTIVVHTPKGPLSHSDVVRLRDIKQCKHCRCCVSSHIGSRSIDPRLLQSTLGSSLSPI